MNVRRHERHRVCALNDGDGGDGVEVDDGVLDGENAGHHDYAADAARDAAVAVHDAAAGDKRSSGQCWRTAAMVPLAFAEPLEADQACEPLGTSHSRYIVPSSDC